MSETPETPAAPPTAPPAAPTPAPVARSKETTDKFALWSGKLGIPINKLIAIHNALMAKLKAMPQYANMAPDFFDGRARHLMAAKYAADLRVKAESFVCVAAFDAGAVDTNANTIALAKTMFDNPETRNQAIQSGLCFADGRPKDQREWFVQPNPEEGIRGRKNPNFGKELKPFWQRRVLAFGRKYTEAEGIAKLLIMTLRGEQAKLELPLYQPIKLRMNIRSESAFAYGLTSSTRTKIESVDLPEFQGWDQKKVFALFDTAPPFNVESKEGVKVTVFNIDEYHNVHKRDAFRTCVLEGDIVQVGDEPTSTGNYLILVGDVEEDIDAPVRACFVPPVIYKTVEHLGRGSRCYFIGTTRLGRDLTTGDMTAITMNIVSILVKIPISKEESLLEVGEEVAFKEA